MHTNIHSNTIGVEALFLEFIARTMLARDELSVTIIEKASDEHKAWVPTHTK
ncbi:MAG TPA: hypothetical protein VK144_00250 [Bacillota bacterium]|nr:hypothetical protein [Bacillota bacterium]